MKFFSKKVKKLGLRSQKIFVVPTSGGYLFFASLAIVFFMGLVYGNNMCFLIAFLMLGQFVAALFISHKNVQKIVINNFEVLSNFSGLNLEANISLDNPQENSLDSFLSLKGKKIHFDELRNGRNKSTTHFVVRGIIHYDYISLYSMAPFGLFKTWRYFNQKGSFYIYPELIELNEDEKSLSGTSVNGRRLKDSDFQEHKRFEKGHSMKRIDWKKFAMKDELLIKNFYENEDEKLIIDLEEIDLEVEEKLKYITTLIFHAHQNDKDFQLITKHKVFSGNGEYKSALEFLSIYGFE